MPPHLYAPYMFVCHQGCTPPPICPHTLLCLCVLGGFACCEGCNGLPFGLGHPTLHHPCLGVPPLYYTPHTVIGSLCIGMFWGYQYVMWAFPFCQEGVGCFPHQLWGWGSSALEMSICSFLYLFCSALCLMF